MNTLIDDTFLRLSHSVAETMAKMDVKRESYWRGYQRSLRRAYHGDKFGTLDEDRKYLDDINSLDEARRETGRGYTDALEDWGVKDAY